MTVRIIYDGNGYTGGTVPVDTTEYPPGSAGIVKDIGDMVKNGSMFQFWENTQNHKPYWPGNRIYVGTDVVLSAVWMGSAIVTYDVSNADGIDGELPLDTNMYAIGDVATVPDHGVITADFAAKKQDDGTDQLEGLLTLTGWKILHGAESDHDILVTGDEFRITDDTVILQGVWGHLDITVSYEMGPNTYGEAPAPQYAPQYRDVEIADMPADAGKSGHRFVRWIDEQSGRIFLPGQKASFGASAILMAVWWPVTYYDVVYDLNGGKGILPPPEHVMYGTRIMLPNPIYAPAKPGYVFDGWVVADHPWRVYTRVEAIPVTSNMVIRARWIPTDKSKRRKITYKSTEPLVTFNANVPVDQTVYLNGDKAVVASWAPAKTGRRMVHWIDKATKKTYEFGDLITIENANIELTAVWEDTRKLELVFTGLPEDPQTRMYAAPNTPVILPMAHSFVREGYFASGWICEDGSWFAGGDTFYVPLKVDREVTSLNFVVDWIDTTTEFSVTYIDDARTFGHLPVDPCKYHAGDIISLAPAGDMRRDGFVLAGWRDVDRRNVYPITDVLDQYMMWDKRDEFDPDAPHLTCRGNYTLEAVWEPAATIAFGSNGIDDTAEFVFKPNVVTMAVGTSFTFPESVYAQRTGYVCVGWKSQQTGNIYPCGGHYTANLLGVEIFQPVWETKNIVEYRIPQELEATVTPSPNWMPSNVYSFGHRPVSVTIPDGIKGRYGWRRSDTGDVIREPMEIGNIHSDITLSLCSIAPTAVPSKVRVFVAHCGASQSQPETLLQSGQEYTFPSVPEGAFGWILDNDTQHLYRQGDRVKIYGDVIVRPALRSGGITIEYAVPETAYGVVPKDTTEYAIGDVAISAPAHGLRGENTTKLLYWYAVDASKSPLDSDIILRVYPGHPFRIPSPRETNVGAIVDTAHSKITLYPMFGDKFAVNFVDNSGSIFSPTDGQEEGAKVVYVYQEPVAENQAIRMPRIVKRERDDRTREEWLAAWEYPYHGTRDTDIDIYAGTFLGNYGDDNEALIDVDWTTLGGWCYVRKRRYINHSMDEGASIWLETTYNPVITTVTFDPGNATGARWITQYLPDISGYWFESFRLPHAVDFAQSSDSTTAVGWIRKREQVEERIPWFNSVYQMAVMSAADDSFMFGAKCRFEVQWRHQIGIHYCLSDATPLQWSNTRPVEYHPRYTQYGAEFAYQLAYSGDLYVHPYLGNHFDVIADGKVVGVSDPLATTVPRFCDRWYPVIWSESANGSIEAVSHPAMSIEDEPISPQDVWLPAVAGIGGAMAGDFMQRVPYPINPMIAKYLKKIPTHDGGFQYEMYYELRWMNVTQIEYHFRDQYGVWISARSDEMGVGDHPIVAAQGSLPGFAVTTYDPGTGRELVFTGWKLETETDAYAYYTDLERVKLIEAGWDTTYVYPDRLDVIRGDTPSIIYLHAQYEYGDTPKPSKKEKEERKKRSKSLLGRGLNYWGTPKQLYHQYATKLTGKDYSSFQSYHTFGVVENKKRNKFGNFLKKAAKFVGGVVAVAATAFAAIAAVKYYKNTHMSDEERIVKLKKDAAAHVQKAAIKNTIAKAQLETLTEERKVTEAEVREVYQEKADKIDKALLAIKASNQKQRELIDAKFAEMEKVRETALKELDMSPEVSRLFSASRADIEASIKDSQNRMAELAKEMESHPRRSPERRNAYRQWSAVVKELDYKKLARKINSGTAKLEDINKVKPEQPKLGAPLQTYDTGVLASLTTAHALANDIDITATSNADTDVSQNPSFHRTGIILKDGEMLVDETEDDAADKACISAGIRKTMVLVDTPIEPDSDIRIPTIQYKPRNVTGNDADEVYFDGDTVTIPDDKRICGVSFLTFVNQYDDNVFIESNYTDGEIIATIDTTACEPHEEYTIIDCVVPAEKRPAGMQFGGWMVDNDTEKIVMPGETILQGMGSHTFTAVWVPMFPPSRFALPTNPDGVVVAP